MLPRIRPLPPSLARATRLARLAAVLGRVAWPPWRLRGALVQVENTSHCNFRCAYCVTHSPSSLLAPRRGHMTMATYARILDAHPEARVMVIQGDGEPLLDPTVFEKIALARARGLVTQIISNGSLLRPAMIERLADEGPDVFLVSLDAVGPATNERNRRGLDYAAVTGGVASLVARRRRGPRVIGLLSVLHGPFGDETAAALRDFDRLGIDVLFYKQLNRAYEGRIRDYRGGPAGAIPAALRRTLSYPISHQRLATTRPCPQLRYRLPYYLWNGEQTACCILNSERYATPDWSHDALTARWQARAMPSECESCSYFGGYPR